MDYKSANVVRLLSRLVVVSVTVATFVLIQVEKISEVVNHRSVFGEDLVFVHVLWEHDVEILQRIELVYGGNVSGNAFGKRHSFGQLHGNLVIRFGV
tara:strand:- start:2588 stop:2878 length:291 start_codon:yes stop_codon:yes gene_type:complete